MSDLSDVRVCFLAGTLARGGAERQLIYMLRALKQTGASIRLLCLTRGEALEGEVKALGIPVEWVGAGARTTRLYRIIQSLRREPADILQSAHFYTNLYTAVAGRAVGIRNIGAIRSNLNNELEANGLAGRGDLFLPTHLIANSALARQRAITRGISPERIDLVLNAVEVESGNGKRDFKEQGTARVLFVGRLIQVKRPDRFLQVLSRVRQELPDRRVKAVIVGDGPLRPEVETLAKTLKLGPDQLELRGELENANGAYQEADLLMLTSDWEGTPNVLLEAMAHSLPVAATSVGGVPEILGDGRGLLADPGDEDALTGAAVRLLSDENLRARCGQQSREHVTRFHSLDALRTQLTSIYSKLLS
jgi:glycosyltransferase involved in cell wall biosynthesis